MANIQTVNPGRPQEYTKEEVIAALERNRGLVDYAAKELKCHPTTVRRYIERYPECREAQK